MRLADRRPLGSTRSAPRPWRAVRSEPSSAGPTCWRRGSVEVWRHRGRYVVEAEGAGRD